MRYEKKENIINILSLEEFDISDILECGQIFRFKKIEENHYEVFSLDKRAIIKQYKHQNYAEIFSEDIDYFENFFDLKTNYSRIKEDLKSLNLKFLNDAINNCGGIRILNQNIFETFVSFVISSNNNIKRIQLIIEKLCQKYGELKNGYYAFPMFETFKNISLEEYKELGLGYRANYFDSIFKQIKNENELINLLNLDTIELKKELLKFKGIGNKVADCILLFGYKRSESFPVDTWIHKMYNKYVDEKEMNRVKISNYMINLFKDNSGIAQQYLFHYVRKFNK